jgi:excisionase family DNA binding protein
MAVVEAARSDVYKISRSTEYDNLPQWLSPSEVAAYTGWTKWTVYQYVHQGHIPYRRVGPKTIQIPKTFFHTDRAHEESDAIVRPRLANRAAAFERGMRAAFIEQR